MRVDAVPLAQGLIRFETVNPPGAEEACAEHLARMLEPHGFAIERYEHEPTRSDAAATAGYEAAHAVPSFAGASPWTANGAPDGSVPTWIAS